MLYAEIHQLLMPYDKAPVECDGFTRLAHTALADAGVAHTCHIGRIVSADGERQSPIHYWIELTGGVIIDYRARMWLGNDEGVPHGVFCPDGYKSWVYQGSAIELPLLSSILARFMVMDL
uniref:hypothetical protein n=1 Tax=Pseudomonas fluorescens TaxID=294 RepID=UPI00186940C1|nr:hypothetical protein [Pseudomonas fluorescens]